MHFEFALTAVELVIQLDDSIFTLQVFQLLLHQEVLLRKHLEVLGELIVRIWEQSVEDATCCQKMIVVLTSSQLLPVLAIAVDLQLELVDLVIESFYVVVDTAEKKPFQVASRTSLLANLVSKLVNTSLNLVQLRRYVLRKCFDLVRVVIDQVRDELRVLAQLGFHASERLQSVIRERIVEASVLTINIFSSLKGQLHERC